MLDRPEVSVSLTAEKGAEGVGVTMISLRSGSFFEQ